MDRITTTIERKWLAAIIAGEKTVEYRDALLATEAIQSLGAV
jgi:hypothetical protein